MNIQNWILSKIFIDGFKQIEKQNFTTKALQICFRKSELKKVWENFINSVISLLDDARDEAEQAKKWV